MTGIGCWQKLITVLNYGDLSGCQRASRLVLNKLVLIVILVYWIAPTWVPKGILSKIRKLCRCLLWPGVKEDVVLP